MVFWVELDLVGIDLGQSLINFPLLGRLASENPIRQVCTRGPMAMFKWLFWLDYARFLMQSVQKDLDAPELAQYQLGD